MLSKIVASTFGSNYEFEAPVFEGVPLGGVAEGLFPIAENKF